MHAPRVAVAKDIFDQDLGLGQVRLIPIHPAAESVQLDPIFSNFAAFLSRFRHNPSSRNSLKLIAEIWVAVSAAQAHFQIIADLIIERLGTQ
jgi:hypothetical protein